MSEFEFHVLNKLAAAGGWLKLSRVSAYHVKRLESMNLIETRYRRTHARLTELGKTAHAEARILRGSGEPIPTEAEACKAFRYSK